MKLKLAMLLFAAAADILVSVVRRDPDGGLHEWARTGPGRRVCTRCCQTVGGPSVVLPLMTCDEAVCREVLDV